MTKARDLANGATALSAVSATELGYLDGVTSAVQTQIDGKQAVNANVSTTELGYLDGVTSAIQTQLDAKIAKTLTSTTGDIIYASGANTPARLGIGSSAQVLTVSGGVPAWTTPAGGGGMTSLATGSLSGTTTTISSISGSYKNLQLILTDFYPSTNTALQFTFNSIADYANVRIGNATTDGAIDSYAVKAGSVIYAGLNDVAASDNNNTCILDLFDYANTSNNKVGQSIASFYTANTFYQTNLATFTAKSTGAITSINIKVASGTFSGGTYTLYGVN